MNISIQDAGNYFRGLLLLVREDGKIAPSEVELVRRIGRRLDFEKEFCDNAISEILANEHIEDAPPEFSSREIALRFIRDGLTLAFSDGDYDRAEELWLRSTAGKNGIAPGVFYREQQHVAARGFPPERLEVDDLTVKVNSKEFWDRQ